MKRRNVMGKYTLFGIIICILSLNITDISLASQGVNITITDKVCIQTYKMRIAAVRNTLDALQHTLDFMYPSEQMKWKPVLAAMGEDIKGWPYKKYDPLLDDKYADAVSKGFVSKTGMLFPVIIKKCAELVIEKSCNLESTKEQISSLYISYIALFDAVKLEHAPKNINDFTTDKNENEMPLWATIVVVAAILFFISGISTDDD